MDEFTENPDEKFHDQARHIPILCTHGKQDDKIDIQTAREKVDNLEDY